jgi:ferritin
MIKEAVEKAIVNQIKNEEHSSRLYLAMASWCQVKGYPGAAAFLYKQTDEERMHQLKFVHYLNDRAGYSKLLALDNPTSEYESLLDIFEKVMTHEEFITASINDLYEVALNNKDYTTGNFLQWFINEQIEEESTMHSILDKMKLAGNESGGLFLIDKELSALAAAKVVATLTTA